jgi:signal transduction histidine kinase
VNEPVEMTVEWCSTAPDLTIDALLAQPCNWRALDTTAIIQGWDDRAFWFRLNLQNRSGEKIERWLEAGHPHMAHISLYLKHSTGWEVREIGYRHPMSKWGATERNYGVLPIELAPHEQQTAWVRLSSDTVIVLYASLWKPSEFHDEQQMRQLWVSLGIGGMGLVFVYSLMMMVLTRQISYGYFAIGQIGLFLLVSITGGAFQRFFWPKDLPLVGPIRDIGSLIILLGMYNFVITFLPQVHRYPVLLSHLRVTVYATVVLIIAGLLELINADPLRFVIVLLCGLYATLLCAKAWRDGDRAAGIIMLAFISFFSFALMRFLVVSNVIAFSPGLSLIPFLSIFVSSPLILLGLGDRTRQLQEEISRVRAESAAQLRFLAQMSHELRSPLDIVLGNAQLLSREARSDAQVNGLNSIFDSGRQLLRIIDHILDYARGAAGMLKIEPTPMRLSTFLRGIERFARLLAVQRNNRFELVLSDHQPFLQTLTVEADAERLRQVLSNLLANAARHTSNGLISLNVSARQGSDDTASIQLEFTVIDTGEGISAEEQEQIFRPFERAESKANYGGKGAGLGLAISRQLVELMGGRLAVRSAPQHGAEFLFNVPVRRLTEESVTTVDRLEGFDAVGYLGPRRTVLVVDDDALGRSILCQLLASLGFEVIQASSGRQAAELLAQRPAVDLVLTDQYMPDGDGWLVLEKVAELMPQVPVLLISAAPPSPPANWSNRLQFAAEFLRPIEHAQLLSRMADILDLHWTEHAVHDAGLLISTDAASNHSVLTPDLALPEVHHLHELAKLVELGQVTAIEEWVRSLLSKQPECAPFADLVLASVQRLELHGLGTFLSAQIEAADQRHWAPSDSKI